MHCKNCSYILPFDDNLSGRFEEIIEAQKAKNKVSYIASSVINWIS